SGHRLSVKNRNGGHFYKDRGFPVMSRALSITNLEIPRLSVVYSDGPTNGISVAFFRMTPRDLAHSCEVFRSLHKLNSLFGCEKPSIEEISFARATVLKHWPPQRVWKS